MFFLSIGQMELMLVEDHPPQWQVVEVLALGEERFALIESHEGTLDVIPLKPEKIERLPESYWHDRMVFHYCEIETFKNVKTIPGTYCVAGLENGIR